ncbi:MAG: PHP domain-containing protein [Planctomycetes bacterium]|nr:PHP domain-containing protein [Planctomycetota bacterium]
MEKAVLLRDIEAIDSGAKFLNVDLHIHSYGASHDVKDVTMTPQAILDSAVSQGIAVIAITDHNSVENVEGALKHADQYKEDVLMLPAVEVTTANGHLLVYFSPESVSKLNRFLAIIDLVGKPGAQKTHTKKSMADVIEIAFGLDGICIAAHIDRLKTGFEMLTSAFPSWKHDIITSEGLYGLECVALEALDWYSLRDDTVNDGAAERIKLLQARAMALKGSGRHELAHIQGSDAHSLTDFENLNPDKQWTRMKLTELSFDAFRTALVDPIARVRAQAVIPRAIPRICGIATTGGFLDGEMIQFSANLNCFIGGRGTGKSTAIRSLAFCFGIDNDFENFGNCCDLAVVYCKDADEIIYRYERAKGGDVTVKAKESGEITDVPTDVFRVEYFGQGELAEVAKDPLKNPQLLQDFLDRHINLKDLADNEISLVIQLRENASQLNPLENNFAQLAGKKKSLADIEKKLKIAEEGNLRDIVRKMNRISSEKTIHLAIENVSKAYTTGLTLSVLVKDFDQIVQTAGDVTGDEKSDTALQAIGLTISATNEILENTAKEINRALISKASELEKHCAKLKTNYSELEQNLAGQIADLKAKGLSGNIAELNKLLSQKASLSAEIMRIEHCKAELEEARTTRTKLLAELRDVRLEMTKRRKSQLYEINKNLHQSMPDYKIFVKYDEAGIIDEFYDYIHTKMIGTYLQDQIVKQICECLSPSELAERVLANDTNFIASTTGIELKWAETLQAKLCYWNILFEMQILAKQPKPIITVHMKSKPPKIIPVIQLSDGQRHTILLTIAMLAESNIPLIIDQPEDDLDNAFIFSNLVATLRSIKERRQVILVTHNSNIAVLGDSELILPMQRVKDCGKVFARGSIDSKETKECVQNILEGGQEAFNRRRQIYGH